MYEWPHLDEVIDIKNKYDNFSDIAYRMSCLLMLVI